MTRFVFADISQYKRDKTVFLLCETRLGSHSYHVTAVSKFEADNAEHIAHKLMEFCDRHQAPPIIEDDMIGAAVQTWLYRLGWQYEPRPISEYIRAGHVQKVEK